MLNKLDSIRSQIGNTKELEINIDGLQLFAKQEYQNFTGSVKDRPGFHMIETAIKENKITPETTVIESSSGNLAVTLATICRWLNIKFIPIIDPNINPAYEAILNHLSHSVVKVDCMDNNAGFLSSRIKKINELNDANDDYYWTNQYENINNFNAYYYGLGKELVDLNLDYIFIGVSSGGGISGISNRIKEDSPSTKVIAVDIEGSVIFGSETKRRYIPGIGSSINPPLVDKARIDEVVMISEYESILGCYELMEKHSIFAGGSTGSVYSAIKKYFKDKSNTARIGFLCADKGNAYIDTIYNESWVKETFKAEFLHTTKI